jgi:hypothetical protein
LPLYEEKTVPMIASPVAVGSYFIAVLFSFAPPQTTPRAQETASQPPVAQSDDGTVNTMSFTIKTSTLFVADTA